MERKGKGEKNREREGGRQKGRSRERETEKEETRAANRKICLPKQLGVAVGMACLLKRPDRPFITPTS